MDKHSEDFDPVLHAVVRRYSLIVSEERPSDTLSQALGANARHEIALEKPQREGSWSAWLQSLEQHSDSEMLRLEKHKKQVAERWETFHADHPDSWPGDVFVEGQGPPPIGAFLQVVQDAEAAWEKKKEDGFGKAKSVVENFLYTMDNHSNLFGVIPSGHWYTSLISGVLTSITKAFVNHKKIAELFSEALERIVKDLNTVYNSVEVSNTQQMRWLVVDLYVAVFSFLCAAMDWYGGTSAKRLVKSLRQDYRDDINKNAEKVKEVLGRIRLQAEQTTQTRIQDTHQGVKNLQSGLTDLGSRVESIPGEVQTIMDERLRIAGERARESSADMTKGLEEVKEQIHQLLLGHNAMLTLLATGQGVAHDRRLNARKIAIIEGRMDSSYRRISGTDEALDGNDGSIPEDVLFSYTRTAIQETAAPYLDNYLQDERLETLKATSNASRLVLPSEVAQKITKWIGDPSSSFLWVEGPFHTTAEKQLSHMAVRICESALSGTNPVPCVSFVPKSTSASREPSGINSRQEKVLISMLYSIAGQLIRLLPKELDSATDRFEMHAFESLDGSLASAASALDLMKSLLAYGPPVLIVIINRLQLAECPATAPHLERFVKLLRAYETDRVIKTLFITQGGSGTLGKTLDPLTEKANARRMVQAKPGEPLRGWSSLGNLERFKLNG